jgi:carboxymethylenebutenolidase
MGVVMNSALSVIVPDGTFSAFVARPKSSVGPVVVVLQEAFGVNDGIREIAMEMAGHGFIAVCPDLYWRVAPDIELSDHDEAETKRGFAIYADLDIGKAVDDVHATVEAVRSMSSTGKVGVMGFCLGGLLTNLTAARYGVDAGVAYYGGGTEKYANELSHVRGPLLMHFGGADEYISQDAQARIRAAASSVKSIEIHVYPNRYHAFARPRGDHYNEADATLANGRTVDFMRTHLAA